MSLAKLHSISTNHPLWATRLRQIVTACQKAGSVKAIYVFGSFAKAQMTGESDLDIAVVLPNSESAKVFREKLVRPLCDWPIDLLVVQEKRFEERKDFGGVLFDVAHEGIELFPNWRVSKS